MKGYYPLADDSIVDEIMYSDKPIADKHDNLYPIDGYEWTEAYRTPEGEPVYRPRRISLGW